MQSAVEQRKEAPKVVSPAEWLAARKEFLLKEKEFTRLRDELSRQRRELPWEKVEKPYAFETTAGTETLSDLFDGRRQLIVYHFMFGPGWKEGCPGCSYVVDHFDGITTHLANRDTTLVAASRAPLAEFQAFKKRMGWSLKWVSSSGSDFNYDYHVSFRPEEMSNDQVDYNYRVGRFSSEEGPGASVFSKDAEGNVYHTYSSFGRGLDIVLGTYNLLDLTPKGRDEAGLDRPMAWLRHHDRYDHQYVADKNATGAPTKSSGAPCCTGEHQQ
jgi:predicted dithiol-disulfide oxidoreductase (DUF899 family)